MINTDAKGLSTERKVYHIPLCIELYKALTVSLNNIHTYVCSIVLARTSFYVQAIGNRTIYIHISKFSFRKNENISNDHIIMLNTFKSTKVEVMRGFDTQGVIKVSARINYVKCIRTLCYQ